MQSGGGASAAVARPGSSPVSLFSGRPSMHTSGGSCRAAVAQAGFFHRRGGLPAADAGAAQAQQLHCCMPAQASVTCTPSCPAQLGLAHLGAARAVAARGAPRASPTRPPAPPLPPPAPRAACSSAPCQWRGAARAPRASLDSRCPLRKHQAKPLAPAPLHSGGGGAFKTHQAAGAGGRPPPRTPSGAPAAKRRRWPSCSTPSLQQRRTQGALF